MENGVDRATFNRLISEQIPTAMAFATRLTGDPDSAEDVVAEALYRAARGWRTFRGRSTFKTWLFGIVVNAFRDHVKSKKNHEPLPEDVHDEHSTEPAESLIAAELTQRIAKLVSALPARQREVLILVVYEGFATPDVAQALDISEANVHSTLHQARRRLKQQLAPYLTGKRHER